MALVVQHNAMASNTARNLNTHYQRLATSTQRLSSGLRINSAADDAAGLAVRELMRADVATLHQGVRNANDAISAIQTADGALQVIDEKLIRMKELSEQAATGTYSTMQRRILDSEFQAMASEINRIANSTDFNGIHLLDGSLSGEHDGIGLDATGALKIHFGLGNDSSEDYYYMRIDSARVEALFSSEGEETKHFARPPVGVTSDVQLGAATPVSDRNWSTMLTNGTLVYQSGQNIHIIDPVTGTEVMPVRPIMAGTNVDFFEIEALGDGAIMTWRGGGNIYAQRIDAQGQALDLPPRIIAPSAGVTSAKVHAGENGAYTVSLASAGGVNNHIVRADGTVTVATLTTLAATNSKTIMLDGGRMLQMFVANGQHQGFITDSDGVSNAVPIAPLPGSTRYEVSALQDGSGGFVVARSGNPKGQLDLFNADGSHRSTLEVDGPMTGAGMSVLGLPDGNIAVVWGELNRPGAVNTGGNLFNCFAQTFNVDGTIDPVFQIDAITDGCEPVLSPSYGAGNTGEAGFTVTYTDHNRAFARTFDFPETLTEEWEQLNIITQDKAQRMLPRVDGAVVKKDTIRAHLGALQNRMENTVTNLQVQAENVQAAESRISDTDVATEMTAFVRNQILSQSAVAMLTQANSMPKMIMQLLG